MMNIRIYCVGKLKERYLKDACDEYLKRLSRYAKVTVTEFKDEPTIENSSQKEEDEIREKEAERIIKALKNDTYVITLEIEGEEFDSEGLSERLSLLMTKGVSDITFIIGGSMGLSESIIKLSDMHLSFSGLTFPHQLMRVILLEQIYRSFRIMSNEPYHK